MTCGIYVIRCKANDKEYVGSSNNIELRMKQHLFHKRGGKTAILSKAIAKHGRDNFDFYIIEETNLLMEREKYWIYKLKPEYNAMVVVERNNPNELGWCASEETRALMSKTRIKSGLRPPSLKGIPKTLEQRAKMALSKIGNKSRTGLKNTPEATEKVRQALLGRKRPPHVGEAVRKSRLGSKATPEQVEANRIRNTGAGNAMYGKKKPPEEIQRRVMTTYRNRILKTLNNFLSKLSAQ